jgi:hypothetical protein
MERSIMLGKEIEHERQNQTGQEPEGFADPNC